MARPDLCQNTLVLQKLTARKEWQFFAALSRADPALDPSHRTVTTTYDGAGRPSQVSGFLSGTSTNYVCEPSVPTNCVLYAAHGAVQQLPMGNGVTETTTFNTRLQPTQIQANGLSTALLTVGYSYGSTSNNGNVQAQTITRLNDSGGQQIVDRSRGTGTMA